MQTAWCNNSAVHTACNQVMHNTMSHTNLGPALFLHIFLADDNLSKQLSKWKIFAKYDHQVLQEEVVEYEDIL